MYWYCVEGYLLTAQILPVAETYGGKKLSSETDLRWILPYQLHFLGMFCPQWRLDASWSYGIDPNLGQM